MLQWSSLCLKLWVQSSGLWLELRCMWVRNVLTYNLQRRAWHISWIAQQSELGWILADLSGMGKTCRGSSFQGTIFGSETKKQNKDWYAATSAVCDSLEFLVSTACPHLWIYLRGFSRFSFERFLPARFFEMIRILNLHSCAWIFDELCLRRIFPVINQLFVHSLLVRCFVFCNAARCFACWVVSHKIRVAFLVAGAALWRPPSSFWVALFFLLGRPFTPWGTVLWALSLTRGPAGNRTTTGSQSATEECRDTSWATRTTIFTLGGTRSTPDVSAVPGLRQFQEELRRHF